MATFPASLDAFANPGAADTLAAVPHHTQHSDANDSIEAIEAKVGTGASTPTLGKVLTGTGTGTSAWSDAAAVTVMSARIHLTPSALTGSVVLPAGAVLLEAPRVIPLTAWDGGAVMDAGDGDDPNGWAAAYDLVLSKPSGWFASAPSGWYVPSYQVAVSGSSGPAYDDSYNSGFVKTYYPSGGTITATVTATAPTVGETTIVVVYSVP